MSDQILNRAAELAFWFLLGFFPMLLSVAGIASRFGSAQGSQGILMAYLGKVLPSSASGLVGGILAQTTGSGRAWFSLLFALWASSSAITGVMTTLNVMYGVKQGRPWWKARLVAVALAIATGGLLIMALIIVVNGPELLLRVVPGSRTRSVWEMAQWPAAAVLLMVAMVGLYRFAPNVRDQRWRRLLPGSIVASLIWIAVSILFKVYVRHFSDFGVLYGSLGTLVILMFWFYLSGVAILIGGEINMTLEKAATL